MRGPLAAHAEIFRRADQPRPEALLPQAIGRDPGRQRVLAAHQPAGQRQSIARAVRQPGKNRRDISLHVFARRLVSTPDQQPRRTWRSHLFPDEGSWNELVEGRAILTEPFNALGELVQLREFLADEMLPQPGRMLRTPLVLG